VPLFRFPLPVRFFLPNNVMRDFTVAVGKAEEDFYFPLPEQPELVRLDPEFTVLAKVDFSPSGEMLKRQLKGDLTGRLLAVRSLAEKKDDDSIALLAGVLAGDPFWGVRREAVAALRKVNNPASRKVLLAAPAQPDARVRLELVEAIGATLHDDARDALAALAGSEKNPEVLAAVITALAPWTDHDVAPFLERPSYREQVAAAVMTAWRARDDSTRVPVVLDRLKRSVFEFPSGDYAAGLDALAFLARRHEAREGVRSFLASHLVHPRERFRQAAARALGTLGDPAALALLRPLTALRGPFRDPVREAAQQSIQQIESLQTGPPELKNIWQRLQELQAKTERLEGELDKLNKKSSPEKK
jgi:aminopeptidase N